MKLKHLLMKTLFVAAGLCVGQSVWAIEANLTPTADTWVDYKTAGDATANHGTDVALTAGIWQDMWTNGTPGLKNNGYGAFAMMKFDVSAYKGKITAASFKITATLGANNYNRDLYLGYYTGTGWEEGSVTANNSGIVNRSATELNIGHLGTFANVTKNSTAEYTCSTLSSLVDYLNNDADGIVTLIFYTYTADISIASKEATTGKPTLTLTYTDETVYTATFTANSGAITPTVTIYSDEERTTPVSNGSLTDKTTYYYRAVLAGYNNYESSFTVDGANPSVSFTMTAKTRYTFTVNAVDAGSNILKTIYTDADSYEGKTHNIVYPKYLTGVGNVVTYSKNTDTYGESKNAQAQNETYTVSYTAYDGVAYFVEVEDVVSATACDSWNYSNGGAVRGFTDAKSIFTVPAAGVYDITYAACTNNVNYDLAVTLSKNNTEIATKTDLKTVSVNYIKTTGIVINNNVSLAKDDVIKLTPSSTNGIVDYMLIELKSVPATIGTTGYTTFASPFALDLSGITASTGEITAYYASSVGGSSVVMTSTEADVEAGTGLLLKGTAGATITIPVAATGSELSGNLLKGCTAETVVASAPNKYVLVNNSGTAEFQNLSAQGATIPAGKAYLDATGAGARSLTISFDDEDVTGVNEVRSQKEDVRSEWFDLQGRKVAQPAKGLYIVNGKKVVIK